jgi:tetratricopeptide (TPR) repeat protein
MFRRLSAWHILTAGLIGLSPAACGSGAREDATSHEKTVAVMPPSVAKGGAELTSVAPVTPPPAAKAEVPPKVVAHSKDEVLDRLVFEAERKPDDVHLRVRVARAMLDAGKLGEARAHAERAVEVNAKSPGAWHMLGRVELAERDYAAAEVSFQHAVELDLENSYAWNNLGYALLQQSKFEDAAIAFEQATSGTSPTSFMWNNLGMAYEHMDRIREARAAYRQAVESGSTRAQANVDRLEGVISLRPADEIGQVEVEVVKPIEKKAEEESEEGEGEGAAEEDDVAIQKVELGSRPIDGTEGVAN